MKFSCSIASTELCELVYAGNEMGTKSLLLWTRPWPIWSGQLSTPRSTLSFPCERVINLISGSLSLARSVRAGTSWVRCQLQDLFFFFQHTVYSQGCCLASMPCWRSVSRDGHRRLWGLHGKVRCLFSQAVSCWYGILMYFLMVRQGLSIYNKYVYINTILLWDKLN